MKKYSHYIVLFLLIQISFPSLIPIFSLFSPLHYSQCPRPLLHTNVYVFWWPLQAHVLDACSAGGPIYVERLWSIQEVWPSWRKLVTRVEHLKVQLGPLVPAFLLLQVCYDVYHLCHAFLPPCILAVMHSCTMPSLPRTGSPWKHEPEHPSSFDLFPSDLSSYQHEQ